MRYEGDIYRPPSEAYSYILQVTVGCSHNRCSFCNMYLDKQFRIRPLTEILEDLQMARRAYRFVDRIFLADGDALIIPAKTMLAILARIRELFPECERITSYASAKDILLKTEEELRAIREAGLEMLYIGLESGSEKVLADIDKGVTAAQSVEACLKAKRCGFTLSITEITGIAGADPEAMEEHALASARALSAIQPEYLGLMTLTLRRGTRLTQAYEEGRFKRSGAKELLEEQRLLIAHLDSEGTVLRSNHISNYIQLRGTLNRDRDKLLQTIDDALARPIPPNRGIPYLESL